MTFTEVERWGELELEAPGPVGAEFHHDGRVLFADGFSTADGRHHLRFMPDTEGEWFYRFDDGTTQGRFVCGPPSAGSHGPVRIFADGLRFADGASYKPLGTTWFGTGSDEIWRVLAASPFDRVRLAASPGLEELGRLDDLVRQLARLGVQAEIVLYGAAEVVPEDDPAYIRQVVPRLAAYWNVSWCLAVDPDRPELAGRDWAGLAALVQEYDHGRHLLTMHAPRGGYDFGQPWLTHLSVSLENLRRVSALRADYGKPVFVDLCGFEGDGADPVNSLTAAELVARIWEGTVRGGHVTHGEWYEGVNSVPWSAGGQRLQGDSVSRLRLLRQVLDEMPAGVEPLEDYRDAPTLAVPGQYYLQYLNAHGFPQRTFSLPEGSYSVDVIDTWNMTVSTLREPVEGEVTVRLPSAPYQAVRIRRRP